MRKPSQELRELLIDARIGDAQTRARKVFNLSQDEEEECVLDCIVSFECVREVIYSEAVEGNLNSIKSKLEDVQLFTVDFYYEEEDGNFRDVTIEDLDNLLDDYEVDIFGATN